MSDAPPTLRTPRLTLRPLRDNDAAAITDGVGNWDVVRWLSAVPHPYDIDMARTWIAETREAGNETWAICNADGLCGVVGLEGGFGYWLARPAWRKGYGFEAAHAAISHWFSDPDRGDMQTGWFHGNDRSGAVLNALGFREIGIGRQHSVALAQEIDHHDVVLTRADWEQRQAFTLTTNRLTIRPMTTDDDIAMVPFGQKAISQHTCTITPDWTEAQARDWIEPRQWQGLSNGTFAVLQGDHLIGSIGFGGTPFSASWMFLPETWGQGIATEALSAFLPEMFARITRARIEAEIFDDNLASQAVARKLGFEAISQGTGTSKGRAEPAPITTFALTRGTLK